MLSPHRFEKFQLFWLIIWLCLLPTPLRAQITTDGTTSTTLDANGNTVTINDGDRAGGNLFHSFGEFSVPRGSEAFFNNAPDVENIINRVTGGSISNIDGLIRANGSANLFLLNPTGIIFGAGARLDIGGSFYGSTADSILFEDGEFSATDLDNPPLLTINAPIGLSFRDNPGDITTSTDNTGESAPSLTVNQGQNLTLVGGNINWNSGFISAPGGRVELGGLAASGTVSFRENGGLNFPEDIARGNVSLTQGALVDVTSGNGGFVTVNANNLEILNGSAILAGIGEGLGTSESQGGDITLNATERLTIQGEANSPSSRSRIDNDININGLGNAGDIIINTANLEGIGNFSISSSTVGQGDAGMVTITASENISLEGLEGFASGIISLVTPSAIGNAGDIIINTSSLSLSNSAGLATSTAGQGNAGDIRVNATDSISLSGSILQAATFGQGDGGNIEISTANLSLTDGSTITGSTGSQGDAGAVTINANGTISADASGIFSTVEGTAVGNSGGIDITTTDLTLTQRGVVNASTFGEGNAGAVTISANGTISADASGIFSQVEGTAVGDSGGIDITTTDLTLTQGSRISTSTFGEGNAGAVNINANGTISADGENSSGFVSGISSVVAGTGVSNSGGINITTTDLTLTQGSRISTSTFGQGDAGAVTISANGTISADGENSGGFVSGISSTVQGTAVGNSGGIEITTTDLTLTQGGVVSASTFGEGNAGIVEISANEIFLDGESTVGFNSGIFSTIEPFASGSAGGINIETTNLTITNGAEIDASTFGDGNAGNITIEASDTITLDGQDRIEDEFGNSSNSGIFANVEPDGSGNAGSIDVTSNHLIIRNSAEINVNSQGQGVGGNLFIQTSDLELDSGSLLSSTSFGQGGNIVLEIADNLTLNRNSLISAEAGSNANGGNIDINTNFIVAFPNGNNDIIASAAEGQGGNINITAEALFGIEERPQNPFTNDIDASSEFGFDGSVVIDTPDVNATQGTTELPDQVVEPETFTTQACNPAQTAEDILADRESSFTVTGRGGLPSQPTDPLTSDAILVEGEFVTQEEKAETVEETEGDTNRINPDDIVPARGMIVKENGEIVLTAYPTPNTAPRTPTNPANCL